jgi:outer membrane protein, heavy metal efflux system
VSGARRFQLPRRPRSERVFSCSSEQSVHMDFCFRKMPAVGLALLFLLGPSDARGDEPALTRSRVVELVKDAPATRVTRSESDVFAAAVTAAGALSLENPVLSGLGGPRFNPDGSRTLSAQAALSWPVDLGGQRGARMDQAKAEHRAAIVSAEGEVRQILLGALLQHQQVLRDQREVALASERHALSERFYAAAQRRRAAGSVPELDVALAAMQETQDASSEAAAEGARDADQLALAALLGLSSPGPVGGSLVPEGEPPPLATAMQGIEQLVSVRAATAALDAAEARAARARAARWPTVSLLAQYQREERADIALLGLAVPIPILNVNRVEVATSAAEIAAASARVAQRLTAASGQIQELYARYLATKAAMDALAPTEALATRAVTLATRGYELGENDLMSVLMVRREAIAVQAALLDVQHTHSAVKIELLVTAGKNPE